MTATIPPTTIIQARATDCPPPPPRFVNDGVVIFVCEHEGTALHGTQAFMDIVKDPPRTRPRCSTCGQPAKHVGPDTARRLLDGEGR